MDKEEKLNKKEKQIVYLSASIAAGCKPCTKYHLRKIREIGFSDFFINKWITAAISVKNNAIRNMLQFATNPNSGERIGLVLQRDINREDILIGIAVTYSVNSPSDLKKYMRWGRYNGISNCELNEIITITRSVIDMARAHVDMITDTFGIRQTREMKKEKECCSRCN